MAVDAVCIVEVGHHDSMYWIDEESGLTVVCTRHRVQYDERSDLGPFKWRRLTTPELNEYLDKESWGG